MPLFSFGGVFCLRLCLVAIAIEVDTTFVSGSDILTRLLAWSFCLCLTKGRELDRLIVPIEIVRILGTPFVVRLKESKGIL